MAKWFEEVSQWHGMYCHDLEVMSLNPGWVELRVRSTAVLSRTWTKNMYSAPHTKMNVFFANKSFLWKSQHANFIVFCSFGGW